MTNHRRFVLIPFLLGLVTLAGCSSVHATGQRMGRVFPSLPAGCPVRFENIPHQEAYNRYEQVGLVTLSGTSNQPQSWDGETRDLLAPKVCEIGGSIVTLNAATGGESHMGMGTGMIQFAVWRERAAAQDPGAAPAAPPQ